MVDGLEFDEHAGGIAFGFDPPSRKYGESGRLGIPGTNHQKNTPHGSDLSSEDLERTQTFGKEVWSPWLKDLSDQRHAWPKLWKMKSSLRSGESLHGQRRVFQVRFSKAKFVIVK